ncbi:MAG: glycosyltransferase [Alphaproteobacteria bacterium]|nr:glycosyltransferase [Alphaproteobacteria bacterium]
MNAVHTASLRLPKASIIIAPAWHSCGSYRVFRAQVEAHKAAGIAPYFLAIHPHFAVLGGGGGLWKKYRKNTADLGTVDRGEARLPWLNFFKPSFLSSLATARKRTPVFTKSLSATHALLPASLAQFMASHEIVAIHCNHYFNLPAAKRVQALAPGARIILETHDIQSFHVRQERPVNPLTLRREPFARYFEDEVAISQAADELIHLNHEEFEAFSAALPGKSHHLIYPSLGRPAASTAPPPVRDIDFLVLGAANRGNFHSLKWFLSEVWDERLAAAANLAIVGGVADLFKVFNPSLYRKYSASFKGSVADVGAWYGRAKTVLLPISEGHGIAIKTLEAFAHAKPVIYTAQALRGFDREPVVKNLPGFAATADEFKARLQAAICSPPAALSEGAAAAAGIYEALFSPETYHAKLAAVLLGGQA